MTLLARQSLCTTHLVEETGAKQTNLSNHMQVLCEAGVVETEPCGRFTYHRPKAEVWPTWPGSSQNSPLPARTAAEDKRACP